MGFPARLRRVGGLRHRALPRRHPMRRRDVGARVADTRSASTIRRSGAASYNGVFYDASAVYRPGKKADGTDLPCEGTDATCGAPWTAVYNNGFAGYPGANYRRHASISPPATRTRSGAGRRARRTLGEADGRRQRIGVPPQRPRLQRRDGERKHDAGDRRRLQLPEHLGHVLGHREMQVRQRLHAERQSVLLHDFAGPVLLGQGRRGLGHDSLREPVGPDHLQVRPLRDGRGDVRSAGVHARRHQAGGLPRQRRRRGQPQRPHVRAGDGEFRQLVRVLPHADPVDEGGLRHRVLGARPEFAGRLPHALGERHAVHERQGFHRREQADVAHQRLQGEPERRHAVAGRDVARRRALRRQSRRLGTAGRHGPARSRDRKVPAELPPAVDRRLLELDAVVRVARRRRPDGAVARQPAGRDRVHAREPTSRGLTTRARPRPATASAISRCTTGFATFVPPSPTR